MEAEPFRCLGAHVVRLAAREEPNQNGHDRVAGAVNSDGRHDVFTQLRLWRCGEERFDDRHALRVGRAAEPQQRFPAEIHGQVHARHVDMPQLGRAALIHGETEQQHDVIRVVAAGERRQPHTPEQEALEVAEHPAADRDVLAFHFHAAIDVHRMLEPRGALDRVADPVRALAELARLGPSPVPAPRERLRRIGMAKHRVGRHARRIADDRRRACFGDAVAPGGEQGDGHRKHARNAGGPAWEVLRPHRLRHDQPLHAMDQRSIRRRQRQARSGGPHALHVDERRRVQARVTAHPHDEIVAAVLTLITHTSRHPPDRGMIEEERFDHALQHIDQVVVATHVRQLMGEQNLELLRREAGERARRYEDDRPQPADHGWHLHDQGFDQSDRAADAETRHESPEDLLQRGGGVADPFAT